MVASDISEAAVRNTRANAARHGVTGKMSIRQGDLFEVLEPGERFDVIFWNSNFVFVEAEHVFDKAIMLAFCDPGYAAHKRFLDEAPSIWPTAACCSWASAARVMAAHWRRCSPSTATARAGSPR